MKRVRTFTRGAALQVLLSEWLISACVVSAIVLIQSILGRYGNDFEAAWTWLATIFVPPVSVLLTATITDSSIHWHEGSANSFKFFLALTTSFVCVSAAILALLGQPFVGVSYFDLFEKSNLLFALWQGIALSAIGAVIFEGR